ncbi:uncharacterized protein [Rutidosis leptorrhynchoides]|uniref:uncharacterized protein n=1 Tax=Rutidosis leptorrhynchoides TaxID=125765 RepID=UPI003A9A665B
MSKLSHDGYHSAIVTLVPPKLVIIRILHCYIGCISSFWHAPWIAGNSFAKLFPRLFALDINKGSSIADRFRDGNWMWHWHRPLRGGAEQSSFDEMMNQLSNMSLSSSSYSWVWMGDADPNCVWCGNEVESEEHIFLNCNISKQVWLGIASWLQIDLPIWQSIDILWIWIDNFPNSKNQRVIVQAIFIAALWNLWRLRNSYAFNDQKFRISHVFDSIIGHNQEGITFLEEGKKMLREKTDNMPNV